MKFLNFLIIPSLVIFIATLTSCDSKLTNADAEKLLISHHNLPKKESKLLNLGFEIDAYNTTTRYKAFENDGLLTTERVYGRKYGNIVKSTLTNKGMQYAIGSVDNKKINVYVADLRFGKITGIINSKSENIAQVEYDLIRENITPFGIHYRYQPGILHETASFIKYDDGWRISDN